jgi:hypothetical protein
MDLALLDCPSVVRFAAGVAVLRAGGVILLTVGREAAAADGLAAV